MTVVKRKNQVRANAIPLCLGILIGAIGMNLILVTLGMNQLIIDKEHSILSVPDRPQIVKSKDPSEAKGWHQINVFYGEKEGLFNDAPDYIKPNQESFAQVGQDSTVLDLLGPNGYFIDLAANDALNWTNTLALEREGWTGLCVEPNPTYWYGLAHRKCTVVGALVAGTASQKVKVKFRGVYGGILKNMPDRLQRMADTKKEPDAPELTRYTVPVSELLTRYNVPKTIDYMSLDVEGSEHQVMKDFPFEEYTIRVLSVERPKRALKALLTEKGYIYLAEMATWGEKLWAHNSSGFTPDHEKIKAIKPRT